MHRILGNERNVKRARFTHEPKHRWRGVAARSPLEISWTIEVNRGSSHLICPDGRLATGGCNIGTGEDGLWASAGGCVSEGTTRLSLSPGAPPDIPPPAFGSLGSSDHLQGNNPMKRLRGFCLQSLSSDL